MNTRGSRTGLLSVFGILGLLQVDDQQADRHADLDRGKADAGRVVHRLEHVGDERLQLVVERLHRLGDLPEDGIGRLIDAANGHGADLVFQVSGFKQSAAARASAWASVPSSR